MKNKDLCSNCIYDKTCDFPREKDSLVFQCEEFRNEEIDMEDKNAISEYFSYLLKINDVKI